MMLLRRTLLVMAITALWAAATWAAPATPHSQAAQHPPIAAASHGWIGCCPGNS